VKNQGKCPTKVAAEEAKAPWYITLNPFYLTLALKISMAFFPSTYKVVLVVSIGVSMILYSAAVRLAPMVLRAIGKFLVVSF